MHNLFRREEQCHVPTFVLPPDNLNILQKFSRKRHLEFEAEDWSGLVVGVEGEGDGMENGERFAFALQSCRVE